MLRSTLLTLPLRLIGLGLAVAIPQAAVATPLIGDDTTIEVTLDLQQLGITLGVEGSANPSIDALGRAVLPITGGDLDLDPLAGTAEHEFSAITLSMGQIKLYLEFPVIDFTNAVLTAFVGVFDGGVFSTPAGTDPVPIFAVRSCLLSASSDPCRDQDGSILLNGFGLDFTSESSALLSQLFGGSFEEGEQFGVALVDVRFEEVPEPHVAALVAVGMTGLWAAGRRRRLRT
jgi:hypothetical protein